MTEKIEQAPKLAHEIIPINIEDELKQSYLDYAMSVIVGRALPDARDGLKPVHRRVLYAMHEVNNNWDKPYKKSARIVGDVMGKYHPHGDAAIYDTIVRMAQPFSLRYMLVDGQGNFGSIDGDSPAAMRYTEIRLSKIAHSLLSDLDKETVDFAPNYDNTEFAPVVLPTRVPNLLVNGSSGIAVGMATNIPPHNLREVIDACIAFLDNPNLSVPELMKYIPGPDFPTAGIINGNKGIIDAYQTGRGKILIRACSNIETEKSGKQAIIINELPYQVNKAKLLEKIGELVQNKELDGVTAIRDESDKSGMRVVVEVRRGENADVLLNNLYKHTQMQVVFGINMVALENNQPKTFSLPQLLHLFLQHRRDVVTKRTIFELRKAKQRAHILEGLGIALANIDEIVSLIKSSKTPPEAKDNLLARPWKSGIVSKLLASTGSKTSRPDDLDAKFGLKDDGYYLSEQQAQAILDMRLQRLTALEQDKIVDEYQGILKAIIDLAEILASTERLTKVIREELEEIKNAFGDARRTKITSSMTELCTEDLIPEEDVIVTYSHHGYVKTQPMSDYVAQRRGGRGKVGTVVKEEDFIEQLLIANTHDTILCFTNRGKLYWLKVYLLPQGSRTSRGKPIVNLLPLQANEKVTAILPVREYTEDRHIFMATANGTVKKVSLKEFSNPRSNGIIAIDLVDDNTLIGASITDGTKKILLFTDAGKAVRFPEAQVRTMGRTARGVTGIRVGAKQKVVSLVIEENEDSTILTATEKGYGKRTPIKEYRQTNRGAQGVISIKVTEKNGKVIGALNVRDTDELMLISNSGVLIRTRMNEISTIGRNTRGVRLINLAEGEKLVSIERIAEIDEEQEN
jgi:DNA gyrase subunit A